MQTILYDAIDSTNDEARRLLALGRLERVACVRAREQIAGRGTRGHTWDSPRDAGVYLTVVRQIDRPLVLDPRRITPALGSACAGVLCEWTGAPITLHGINDLYADGGKLGGLLTEVLVSDARPTTVLVGLGVNVRAGRVRLPIDDHTRPIALEDLTPAPLGGASVIVDLAHALAEAVDAALVHWMDRQSTGVQASGSTDPCPPATEGRGRCPADSDPPHGTLRGIISSSGGWRGLPQGPRPPSSTSGSMF